MYIAQETKDRIKFLCKTKKINMENMLSECSLGVNAIRQINDTKGMASFSLAKIADYLDCSVDYLLGRTDNPNVNGNIINTGNTGVVTGDYNNSSINSINSKEPKSNELDSTTLQIAKAFQDLDIFEKTEVMNLISKLSKK